jgi:hypothetical protein
MTDRLMLRQARIAGAAYLIIIVLGLFAEVARVRVVVDDDATATAERIIDHELLFRAGLAAGVVVLLCNAVVVVSLFELFKPVHASLARLLAFLGLVSTAIEGANLINHAAPLTMLDDRARLAAEAYQSLQIQAIGYAISLAVFGLFCLVAGYLTARSGFLPRWLGWLLTLAGTCYLVNSFATFLAPGVAEHLFPLILAPCFVAETSFSLWLLIAGVKVRPTHPLPMPAEPTLAR